jgi:XTP/dITP diphosphohydrolase
LLTVVIASHNQKKAAEMQEILAPLDARVITLGEAGVTDVPEETGSTFAENAYIKAKAAFEATGLAVIADDSGLCVDALGGAPGVYSARYGGFETDGERNEHLLRQMKDIENRAAHFACAAVCLIPQEDGTALRIDTYGECGGEILTAPRGDGGFGYDPLFYLPDHGKTTAELAPEDKHRISHRGAALRGLLEKWPGV